MSTIPNPPAAAKSVRAGDVARQLLSKFDERPDRWLAGSPFEALDLRPGRVIVIGAPPGAGKTTLALQVTTNVLALHPTLRCVVGNIETGPETLVEKMLARFATVPLDGIMNRNLIQEERDRIAEAVERHAGVLDRMEFMPPPFTVPHLAKLMQSTGARLAIVDYAQRFVVDDGKDGRAQVDKVMGQVRELANMGAGVILISSVSRQRSSSGSANYKKLSMASFRGSAELEFGADSAYILDKTPEGIATLQCCKQRFGDLRDVHLRFRGEFQRFDAGDPLDAFAAEKSGVAR